jgi:hypothetical protein
MWFAFDQYYYLMFSRFCVLILVVSSSMAAGGTTQLDVQRLEFAREVIRQYSDKIPPNIQQDILAQRVSIGMPPYEASLAAGAYSFQVEPDAKWPKATDPQIIIQAQTMHPDASKIWLTFENGTQYPADGIVRFRVFFQNGKAVEINPLPN